MTVIRKKCKRSYPSDYLLVVHARNYGKEINFDRVIEEMKRVQSPFLEVWVIAVVGLDDVKVVRVSPGLPVVDLKIRAELERASKQVPFLKRAVEDGNPDFTMPGRCSCLCHDATDRYLLNGSHDTGSIPMAFCRKLGQLSCTVKDSCQLIRMFAFAVEGAANRSEGL